MKPIRLTRPKKRRKTRLFRQRLFFLLTLILCVLVLLAGMRFLGSFQALQNRADWAQQLRQSSQATGTNYLIYGLQRNGGEVTIEELFFLNFPAQGAPFHTVFIPGKVLLHRLENGNGTEQLLNGTDPGVKPFYTPDHFYEEGGAELLIQQTSLFLDTPIHHYLEFDYKGIFALADVLGDIQEAPPLREAVSKNPDDHLSTLQEEKGEEFLGDALNRMGFLGKLLKVLTEKKGKLDLYRTINSVSPYFKTDLAWKELRDFQKDIEPFFRAEGLVVSLPGTWREFDDELFLEPNSLQLAALSGNLGGDFILPRELITVEVLNGSGGAGVASAVGDILEKQGFCVVKIDNADHFEYQRSQVISRLEQVEPAKEVAQFVPEAELLKEPLPDYAAMVTVIIGKNFSP